MNKNKFNIGDKVCNVATDNTVGIITDYKYIIRDGCFIYSIYNCFEKAYIFYNENELRLSKTFY